MICWRSLAFLRSRRPGICSSRTGATSTRPSLNLEGPPSLSLPDGVAGDCARATFERRMVRFLLEGLHGAPLYARNIHRDSCSYIIVTNAELQATGYFRRLALGQHCDQ